MKKRRRGFPGIFLAFVSSQACLPVATQLVERPAPALVSMQPPNDVGTALVIGAEWSDTPVSDSSTLSLDVARQRRCFTRSIYAHSGVWATNRTLGESGRSANLILYGLGVSGALLLSGGAISHFAGGNSLTETKTKEDGSHERVVSETGGTLLLGGLLSVALPFAIGNSLRTIDTTRREAPSVELRTNPVQDCGPAMPAADVPLQIRADGHAVRLRTNAHGTATIELSALRATLFEGKSSDLSKLAESHLEVVAEGSERVRVNSASEVAVTGIRQWITAKQERREKLEDHAMNAAEARSGTCSRSRARVVADVTERFEQALREFAEGDTRLRFVKSEKLVARPSGTLIDVRFPHKTEAHLWLLGFAIQDMQVTNEAGTPIQEETAFSGISGRLYSPDAHYPTRQAPVAAGGHLLIRVFGEGCAVVLVAERDYQREVAAREARVNLEAKQEADRLLKEQERREVRTRCEQSCRDCENLCASGNGEQREMCNKRCYVQNTSCCATSQANASTISCSCF